MLATPYPIALDLGSAWTRAVSAQGRRFCADSRRRGVCAVRAGAVVEGGPAGEIVHEAFESLRPRFSSGPKVLACLAASATERERTLYASTLYRHGASSVTFVPQALAAALGAGVDPGGDYAQMVVDIGDELTECAVVRRGRVEVVRAMSFGCGGLREAFFETRPMPPLRGGQWHRWTPASSPEEEPPLADEPLSLLAEEMIEFFRDLPDRLACEVIESGVILVGGGALLRGVRGRLSARTGLLIRVPPNPLSATIEGAAQMLPYAGR